MVISDDPPIVHEVEEITPEVYKDAEQEALETDRTVIVNVFIIDEGDNSNESQ